MTLEQFKNKLADPTIKDHEQIKKLILGMLGLKSSEMYKEGTRKKNTNIPYRVHILEQISLRTGISVQDEALSDFISILKVIDEFEEIVYNDITDMYTSHYYDMINYIAMLYCGFVPDKKVRYKQIDEN